MSQHKQCNICKVEKKVSYFRRDLRAGKLRHRAVCKECESKIRYKGRMDFKRACIDYLGGSCIRCGFTTDLVEVFEFHHRDPILKEFSISNKEYNVFYELSEALKLELDKCDLMCPTCHRLVHVEYKAGLREGLF